MCGTARREARMAGKSALIEGFLPLRIAGVDDRGAAREPTLLTRISMPPKAATVASMTALAPSGRA
jgi:hypothetical protein